MVVAEIWVVEQNDPVGEASVRGAIVFSCSLLLSFPQHQEYGLGVLSHGVVMAKASLSLNYDKIYMILNKYSNNTHTSFVFKSTLFCLVASPQ